MRVLLDESLPIDLAGELPGHRVETVVGLGWSGVLNGELLRRAESICEAFVTLDRNIEFQQNIAALPFGVVLVHAVSNRMADLRPLIPRILEAVAAVEPGRLLRVAGDRRPG